MTQTRPEGLNQQTTAKKPNIEAADCTNNNDSKVEESEINFYKTVSEQEPSLKDIKDMLSCVQATLNDIQHQNRKLKSSINIQEMQLNSLRESLSKATKANNARKLEIQALRVGTKSGVVHGLGHGVGYVLPVVNFPKNPKN